MSSGPFYVIDYDANPAKGLGKIDGVGKFVLQPQKIQPRIIPSKSLEKDELRELFGSMRDIARAKRTTYFGSTHFFNQTQALREKASVFRKQGKFMKDFTDNYSESTPLESFFPDYQMMNYEQLRTYFTWRTQVREGNFVDISLSYAFLYIYELLNNIGVATPQDGLNRLMAFWKVYRVHHESIDNTMFGWLRDYHVYYYTLKQPFKDFAKVNGLTDHYRKPTGTDGDFDLFCDISNYDIRRSIFYSAGNQKLFQECLCFVFERIRQTLCSVDNDFDSFAPFPTMQMVPWHPFEGALFCDWARQPDRQVVFSEREIYKCENEKWTVSAILKTETEQRFIGYIMKQTECVLRNITKFKGKISADVSKTIDHENVITLYKAGVSIEKLISNAVTEFYREMTKTVVTIDPSALSRIRQESLATQKKLTVPEQEEYAFPYPLPSAQSAMPPTPQKTVPYTAPAVPATPNAAPFSTLKAAFSETELQAIRMILRGDGDIKQFADANGVMLEVLIDGINEKAMDAIGDNLLDEEFMIYDDYTAKLTEYI
ncbi:MAG: TerB N-terminal domain-containing protein [Oscillospiraceae bacterium]|nr:TerB N-terminal domain-containing protein [Oscillospiraceae bacterium]